MQQERKERLTPSNRRSLQKAVEWGKTHPKYKKQINILLTLMLLWFYLLATLRHLWDNNKVKYTCYTISIGAVALFLFSYDMNGNKSGGISDFGSKILHEQEIAEDIIDDPVAIHKETDWPDIRMLQKQNSDCKGWLYVADTDISYPVMQHKEDNDYYLDKDFYKRDDDNGSLILDQKSDLKYEGGNIIIHGHNMKSGEMFGNLTRYKDEFYAKEHNLIQLKTNKEIRKYKVMSVFYSKVYYVDEDVFKYYKYFGGTKEEFDDFYSNIKEISIYDTGVEAVYGDEFITLSTCEYHVENGRFVVIGKRIY